ncbi:MAG: prepilin-type cleavage/methylation domain-containing protein, partial [Gammaproteobacteria bacterium]
GGENAGSGNTGDSDTGGNNDSGNNGNSNAGKARKDLSMVPLNTDYDLYSRGKDGASTPPLSAPVSQDDVLRANNGGFIGLASKF